MKTHNDPSYLDDKSLGRFLRERLDSELISDRRVPGLKRPFRPDHRSEKHKLIVEFDGYYHYEYASRAIDDEKKDQLLRGAGYKVVRVPYFVQMREPVIGELFGELVKDRTQFKDWPHGFITKEGLLPADFCELGIQRFLDDLDRFAYIRSDILGSLKRAAEEKGDWRLVYPPSLCDKLAL